VRDTQNYDKLQKLAAGLEYISSTCYLSSTTMHIKFQKPLVSGKHIHWTAYNNIHLLVMPL